MITAYNDPGSLDEWLTKQAIEHAERGVSQENVPIPATVERLGKPYIYLYATLIFDLEVANGGLSQFFENSSGALAPIARDALQEMGLGHYAAIMTQLIDAFGEQYPRNHLVRLDKIDMEPALREMLDHGYDAIDVWSSEFIVARESYAEKLREMN